MLPYHHINSFAAPPFGHTSARNVPDHFRPESAPPAVQTPNASCNPHWIESSSCIDPKQISATACLQQPTDYRAQNEEILDLRSVQTKLRNDSQTQIVQKSSNSLYEYFPQTSDKYNPCSMEFSASIDPKQRTTTASYQQPTDHRKQKEQILDLRIAKTKLRNDSQGETVQDASNQPFKHYIHTSDKCYPYSMEFDSSIGPKQKIATTCHQQPTNYWAQKEEFRDIRSVKTDHAFPIHPSQLQKVENQRIRSSNDDIGPAYQNELRVSNNRQDDLHERNLGYLNRGCYNFFYGNVDKSSYKTIVGDHAQFGGTLCSSKNY